MKADDWKEIFRQKGWWQGNKIVTPPGWFLDIYFGDNRSLPMRGAFFQEVNDLYFLYHEEDYTSDPSDTWQYFCWEDIVSVRVWRKKNHPPQ